MNVSSIFTPSYFLVAGTAAGNLVCLLDVVHSNLSTRSALPHSTVKASTPYHVVDAKNRPRIGSTGICHSRVVTVGR